MTNYHYNKNTKKIVICRAIKNCKLSPKTLHGKSAKEVKEKIEFIEDNNEKQNSNNFKSLPIDHHMELTPNVIIQGVYGAFNLSGECLYVGLSENINGRIKQHIQELKRMSRKKSNWPDFYKKRTESIIWRLLEEVEDREKLNDRENYWWSELIPLYNNEEPSKNFYKTGGNTRKRFPGVGELAQDLENLTIGEIMSKYNVTKSSVYGWIRKYDLTIHKDESLSQLTRKFYENNSELILTEVSKYTPITIICKKFKIDRQELLQIFKENEIFYGYKLSKERISREEIIKELDNKLSLKEISKKYGIILNHLSKMIKEYRIKR